MYNFKYKFSIYKHKRPGGKDEKSVFITKRPYQYTKRVCVYICVILVIPVCQRGSLSQARLLSDLNSNTARLPRIAVHSNYIPGARLGI